VHLKWEQAGGLELEKVQDAPVCLGRALAQILASQDQEPISRERGEPALQLLGVGTTRDVGELGNVTVLEALMSAGLLGFRRDRVGEA
jgi:hypothetical protein